MRDSLCVPSAVWERLEPALRQKIEQIRRDIRSEYKKSPNHASKQPTKPSSEDILPPQYPSMQNTTSTVLNSLAEMSIDEENSHDTDDELLHHILMTNVVSEDIEVHAHMEYAEAYSDTIYAIADGGGRLLCCRRACLYFRRDRKICYPCRVQSIQ